MRHDDGGSRKRDTAELLAAYVDGVGELTALERRRVDRYLASDPVARSDEGATRELLGKLRELPSNEPDWSALENSILDAVPDQVPGLFSRLLRPARLLRGWRWA